ncbi:Hemin receptor [Methylophilaceae bacterium]|nr:Hemin receptor [Methylophilaceae bacterium]
MDHTHAKSRAYKRRYISTLLALMYAGSISQAMAESEPVAEVTESQQPRILNEVVVSATRTEQDVNDIAATVTTKTADDIEKEMPTDIKDLLRYETGVSVRSTPNRASAVFRATGRAGNEGINIRGLEGDQVLLQTDGVRLPMIYESGPYAAGRGDYIDVEAYKRVEILRGPASTQYGSDGLSGAVSFLTKDPQDLLTLGKPWQAALKTTYASVDNSWTTVPSFAYANDVVEAMLLASIRNGRETENMGDIGVRNINRTEPNPSDIESQYLLAKLVLKPSENHQFKITIEDLDREVKTTPFSFFGDPFTVAALTNVQVKEDITRRLYKLDYAYDNGSNRWFQRLNASLYRQDSKNEQFGLEERSTAALALRTRTTEYAEDAIGGSLQLESNFGNEIAHRVIYGLDASFSDVTSFKDGFNSSGAAFVPNKSFPDTDYELFGAFIQDEINVGQFSVIPGLRYDRFELKPHVDSFYLTQNQVPPSTLKDDEISPKLGVIWKVDPLANIFAQYAHGFRAPKPSQVNGGVTNLVVATGSGPYTSIGNPNLKPETSDSIELGIRGQNDRLRYSASAFKGKYKDFISSNVQVEENVPYSGDNSILVDVLQSINIGRVDISGYELRGEWAFHDNWSISAAYAHTKGESKEGGVTEPLDTIDPDKLVVGLRYDKSGNYGAQLMMTAVERKSRAPLLPTGGVRYKPENFEIFDLAGYYNFNKNFSVHGGVFNIFDRKHFLWADVRNLSMTATDVDAYSQPGRNASVSFKYQF